MPVCLRWFIVLLTIFLCLASRDAVAQSRFRSFDPWAPIVRGQEEDADEERPLESDRPDFTEASSVVPRGRLQIESGYTFAFDDEQGTRVRSHSAPEMLFRYGICENAELRLVWNYAWQQTSSAGNSEFADGAEDLTLGTKLALTSQQVWIPESALILHVTTPTGGTEFTNRHAEFELNYLYGWDLPDNKTLGGSLGYATGSQITFTTPSAVLVDRHNIYHFSLTHGFPLIEPMNMYVEYFGLYFDGLAGGQPQNYIDSGITYLVNNNLQFDVRFGIGLNNAADDFFSGVGMVVRF